jgi:hypothetical protein
MPDVVDERSMKIFAKSLIFGPIASLALGLVALAGAAAFQSAFLLFLGFESLGVFAATAIFKGGEWQLTDIARYRRLSGGDLRAQCELALTEISFLDFLNIADDGKRLACIATLRGSDEPRYGFLGEYYALRFYVSAGDNEQSEIARRNMSERGERIPKRIARTYFTQSDTNHAIFSQK